MRRLKLIGSWKRLGVQAGFLGGLGLAFVGGSEQPAEAGGVCPPEADCSFKKPNFMIVLDYSSSMNEDFGNGQTRWEAAVEAIGTMFTANNGYFDDVMHFGLIRFGHDPAPGAAGTMIMGDTSGLVDGVKLDVHWYDPAAAPDYPYFECNGDAITSFLAQVDSPLCNNFPMCSGIGTWTFGGLSLAEDTIIQTQADHPADLIPGEERFYATMVMSDGQWTEQDGIGMNAAHDPAIPAGDMYNNLGVPTYVVAFGGAVGLLDNLAIAGGTGSAIDAGMGELIPALQTVLDDIISQIVVPECTSGLPRIMILLDASSSMLNVDNGMGQQVAGGMGLTGWDMARDALSAGPNSLFDTPVVALPNMPPLEDLVHLGLTVFGHNNPDETQLLAQYGPCMKDNFSWALDPNTSCAMPGCVDPWAGPPITWTFVGPGDATYPGFDQDTYSHMPSCNVSMALPGACTGSGTYVHLGLNSIQANQMAYAMNPPAMYPADASTQYINILITDGAYNSTDAQVSAPLTAMYGDNITTYVIGFGDLVSPAQLTNMACWGSGGAGTPCVGGSQNYYDANNQAQLEQALADIIEQLNFDPCCAFNDCSFTPEPTTNEPDPIPPPMTTTSESSSSDDGMGTTDTGGTTTSTTGTTTTTSGSSESSSDGSASATTGSSSDSGPSDSSTTDPSGGTDSGDASSTDTDADGSTSASGTNGESGVLDESGSSDSMSASGSNSNSNSATGTATDASGTATAGDTDTETDTVGGIPIDDDCSCQTDNAPRSLLASLLTFGFVGAFRRRRRTSIRG